MEGNRDLLQEIRDAILQHSANHAAWIEHERKREAEIDQMMAASMAIQRAQGAFYRRTVLTTLILVIVGVVVLYFVP